MTASPPALRWSHVALNCADQAATEAFYRRWFGMERAREVPLGNSSIVFLRLGTAYLELFPALESGRTAEADGPRETGVARHLAFQTDDLDAFLGRLDETVALTLGPLAFDEVIPGWRSVWLLDPDGVVVEVSQGYQDEGSTPPPCDHLSA